MKVWEKRHSFDGREAFFEIEGELAKLNERGIVPGKVSILMGENGIRKAGFKFSMDEVRAIASMLKEFIELHDRKILEMDSNEEVQKRVFFRDELKESYSPERKIIRSQPTRTYEPPRQKPSYEPPREREEYSREEQSEETPSIFQMFSESEEKKKEEKERDQPEFYF